MHIAWQLWRERGSDALWRRCLGFLDWSAEQTVAEQRRALAVQLRSSAGSSLLQQLTGGQRIESDRHLREVVPLTKYEDYTDTLGERRDEALSAPAARWLKTTGRSNGRTKWIPLSERAHEELAWSTLALFIAARARERGDVRLPRELGLLNMTAPPPYFSGTAVAALEEWNLWRTHLYPANDPTLDALPFEERMALGFSGAARRGVDFAISYSSVLAGVGGSFPRQRWPASSRSDLRQRSRQWKGRLDAWLGRRGLLPRDVWSPKAIIAGGMDAALFRSQIVEEWGCDPLELFGSTDGLFLGMQTWDRDTITLIPQFNFFEFIPESELELEEQSPGTVPRTLLLDELSVGEAYELVTTSLLGGALVRYRTGEVIRLSAATNSATKAALPQFTYQGQRSDLVEIAGFARLGEQTFLRALRLAGVADTGWTVRKEVEDSRPIVHLRLELADPAPSSEIADRINSALRHLDADWRDMEDFAEIHPLRLTLLEAGTFVRVRADAGGRSIPRVNPPEGLVLQLDQATQTARAARSG